MNRCELFENIFFRWDSEQLKNDISAIIPFIKKYGLDPVDVRSITYICKTCKDDFSEAIFSEKYSHLVGVIAKKTLLSDDYVEGLIKDFRNSKSSVPTASVVNFTENIWSDGKFEYKPDEKGKSVRIVKIIPDKADVRIPEKITLSGKAYPVTEIRGVSNLKNKKTP